MLDAGSGDNAGHVVKLRGLPFTTTAEEVVEFLGNINIINGIEGVHLTEVRPGRPSGECFVEVEGPDDVKEALKKDKENMGKRYIEVFSTDRQDMEWALNAMKQNENGFACVSNVTDDMGVVKLRGLPFGCSKDDVVQFFDGLQVAPDGVQLLPDSSGRASGEAFVYFTDQEGAQEALNRDREKIGHRYIEVFPSSVYEMRSYNNRMDGGGGRMAPALGRGYGRPTPYDRGDRFGGGGRFQRGGARGRGASFGGGGGVRPSSRGGRVIGGSFGGNGYAIHMRGLPFKASPQDIAYFFKPIRPMNINIMYDKSGRPSGEADVEFECHEDAMRAMRRDKNHMDHRYIELFMNSAPTASNSANGGYRTRNY